MSRRPRVPFRPLVLVLAALLAGACQSTPREQGAATGRVMSRAAKESELGIERLHAAVLALQELGRASSVDLEARAATYARSVRALDAAVERMDESAADLENKGQGYLDAWDLQLSTIQNEEIKGRSAESRAKLSADLAQVRDDFGKARERLARLASDLRDVRSALAADLSPAALDTVQPVLEAAPDQAKAISEQLSALAPRMRELAARAGHGGSGARL